MKIMANHSLLTILLCLLMLGTIRSQIDPKIALPLSTLPADLRLPAVVGPGVDSTTCNKFWFKTG